MIGGQGSSSFRRQLIELTGGDPFIHARTHFLRHKNRVTVFGAQTVTEFLEASGDLIKVHRLLPPISLHNIHLVSTLFLLCLSVEYFVEQFWRRRECINRVNIGCDNCLCFCFVLTQ